jgi:hypothetical protein
MPKSRKDKSRKNNVNDFKQSQKKTMEVPSIKPFRQVPHWEPDADIVIKGSEFNLLQNFFNVFAEPINIMQDIFSRSLNNGTISIKYIDNEGKEVSKEEVQAYMTQLKEYFQSQADAKPVEVEEQPITEVTSDSSEVQAIQTEPAPKAKRKLKVA